MNKLNDLLESLESHLYRDKLLDIYEDKTQMIYQEKRYIKAILKFQSLFEEDDEIEIYSAPGRSEVGGNHTDHQYGKVLATSVNLDAIAVVHKRSDEVVRIVSDGYDMITFLATDSEKQKEEEGTTDGIIRGVFQGVRNVGFKVGGFDAFITSDVLMGAGLSSSAAFETVIGTILSGLFNDMKITPVTIAQIGQYSENEYFGKPCGLMDQMACSVGGLISIDFLDVKNPKVEKVDVDFGAFEYSLCIVDTKGSHADLTDEYAAIPNEMKALAAFFQKSVLREVSKEAFYQNLSGAREELGDRAVLRGIHFYEEEDRVDAQVLALKEHRFLDFLKEVKASGDSSYKYLQNVYCNTDIKNQSVSIGLGLSDVILGTHGVSRVHGGGFAGTIQAFVENGFVKEYKTQMEKVFGKGSCHVLKVRKYGGIKVA